MITSLLGIILSTALSLLTAFSGMGARAEAPGVPAWDQAYYTAHYTVKPLLPRFEIEFDEPLREAFEGMKEESGLDVIGIANSIPDVFALHRWMAGLFSGFLYNLRDTWMAKGDSYEGEGGDGARMVLYRALGTVVAMPVKARFVVVQDNPDDPDDYLVNLRLTYADGSEKEFTTYSRYNAATGEFGEYNGIAGLGYNIHFKSEYGPYTTTTDDSWQRSLGYFKLYDDLVQKTDAAKLTTVRLKFPYAGKDWMLQLWKGRYFVTTGAEIGLYNKPPSRLFEFYDAASDTERVGMSFKLTAHDKGEDITLIDLPARTHWWLTCFAVRKQIYTPDKLTLETEIIPIDDAMKAALKGALDREMANNVLTYTESGSGSLLIKW